MTSQSLFWIEATRFGQLLEDAGVDSSWGGPREVSPKEPLPASASTEVVRAIEISEASGPKRHSAPEFVMPTGSLEARLTAFMEWLENFGIDHCFISDQDGLALIHRNTTDELVAASSALSNLWESVRLGLDLSESACFGIELVGGGHIYIMPLVGLSGLVKLGFQADRILPEQAIKAIRDTFHQLAPSFGMEEADEQ